MNKKKKVTVLIADDQTLFREGIKDVLTGEKWIEVVGEAADGVEAVAQAKKLRPDVVLMDIKLPKLDGINATRQINGQTFARPSQNGRRRHAHTGHAHQNRN